MMRRALQAVVLAGVLVLTSACSLVDRAGAAAVVDGERFTTEQLANDFSRLDAALGSQQKPGTMDALNRAILTMRIGDVVLKKAASMNGVEVNKVAVGKLHRQLMKQLGGAQQLDAFAASKGVPPNMIWLVLTNSVLTTDLGAKLIGGTDTNAQDQAANAYLAKLASEMKIEVSPRFGTWDAKTLTVTAGKDELSTSATAATS